MDIDIRGLPLKTAKGLMEENPGMGKRKAFPLRSRGEQDCRHAGCLSQAEGSDIRLVELHRIVNRQSRCDNPTR